MIVINTTPEQRTLARADSKKMGVLHNSFSRGRGNLAGNIGEILVLDHIGGERVGAKLFTHDIVLPTGIKVDVKTTLAAGPPEPHYVARVYGSEKDKEKLCTKCDVYYFVRCNQQGTLATIVGWLPAREFIERATFLPRGHVNPDDNKLTFSDEYSLPISELISPKFKITKKKLALAVGKSAA